jgi:hypothetical protein
MKTATEYLEQARLIQEERAKEYDTPGGERSMAAVVTAFNVLYDKSLTETEGWGFMILLKMRRGHSAPGHHEDSSADQVSYSALQAESSSREGSPKG